VSAGSSESQSPELANRSVPPLAFDGLLIPAGADAGGKEEPPLPAGLGPPPHAMSIVALPPRRRAS
jgi:hypothetical protein